MTKSIRTSAKAVILQDGKVLLTKMQMGDSIWYALPGGGQNHGETLDQTVVRECVEELGIRVRVGSLIHVREYIGANHEFHAHDGGAHQVEHWFLCEVDEHLAGGAENRDSFQTGQEWVAIEQLSAIAMYPKIVRELVTAASFRRMEPVYLGDTN